MLPLAQSVWSSSSRLQVGGFVNRLIVDDSNRWLYPSNITRYGNLFYLDLSLTLSLTEDSGISQPAQLFGLGFDTSGRALPPEFARGVLPQSSGSVGFVMGLGDQQYLHLTTRPTGIGFDTELEVSDDNVTETVVPGANSQFNGICAAPDVPNDTVTLAYLEAGPIEKIHRARLLTIGALTFSDANTVNSTGRPNGRVDMDPMPTGSPNGAAYVLTRASFGSAGDDDSLNSIQARFVDSLGITVGAQFQVNDITAGNQLRPRVAVADDGDVVFTWHSDSSGGDDDSGTSVQARRFNPDGTPKGAQFQVNQTTQGNQYQADVAVYGDGGFTVVWVDQPISASSIVARDYDATGNPEIDELILSTEPNALSPQAAARGEDLWVSFTEGIRVY
ncbi:MAG: hypothetical protein AAGJ52_06855 [Pseudomonadota bacterium]